MFFGFMLFSFLLTIFCLSQKADAAGIRVSDSSGINVIVDDGGSEPTPISLAIDDTKTVLPLAFLEKQEFVLEAPLHVDMFAPGIYSLFNFGLTDTLLNLTAGTFEAGKDLDAGTHVWSYFLHFNTTLVPPVLPGETATGAGLRLATLAIDGEIIGVIVKDNTLDQSDAILGRPGVIYTPSSTDNRDFSPLVLDVAISINPVANQIQIAYHEREQLGQLRILTTGPTIVSLVDFTANSTANRVDLKWVTETETNNAGFNIWRSEDDTNKFNKINDSLIMAQGGSSWGAEYSFTDSDIKHGRTYHYQLEDVELDGDSALHGPLSVKVERARKLQINHGM